MNLIQTTAGRLVEDATLYMLMHPMGNRTEAEDLAAGHEDPADVADRDYPRQ